ncbi:MAG: hypothetical protein H0T42_14395 [Deltaproteobacteria bacterium]|nr:hypothetical protein [Deltaproteobacteria bacterium]
MSTRARGDAAGAGEEEGVGWLQVIRGSVFGTLEPVFADIWWAWGTTRFAPGVLLPRNMTVVRERGELVGAEEARRTSRDG